MKRAMLTLAAGALVWAVAAPALAAVIFSDNFNRAANDVIGNGWSESEADADDIRIVTRTGGGRQLRLRDGQPDVGDIDIDAAVVRIGLSTLYLTDIQLAYEWAPIAASDSTDFLHVEWRLAGGNWNSFAVHALGGPATSYTAELWSFGAQAENVSAIEIRFWTDVTEASPPNDLGDGEGAFIDNVRLTGVPEPASLALLGLGLVGLGFARRRR